LQALQPSGYNAGDLAERLAGAIAWYIAEPVPVRIVEINDVHCWNLCFIQGQVIVIHFYARLVLKSCALELAGDLPQLLHERPGAKPRILLYRKASVFAADHVE